MKNTTFPDWINGVIDILDELTMCEREGCTPDQAVFVLEEKRKLGQDGQNLYGDHF